MVRRLARAAVKLLGLFEAVAVGFDVDDLGAVDEAIDQPDDAGGVRKDGWNGPPMA